MDCRDGDADRKIFVKMWMKLWIWVGMGKIHRNGVGMGKNSSGWGWLILPCCSVIICLPL